MFYIISDVFEHILAGCFIIVVQKSRKLNTVKYFEFFEDKLNYSCVSELNKLFKIIMFVNLQPEKFMLSLLTLQIL